MLQRLRKLLPTRDEGRKLWLEVWKYVLIACLAAGSLFFSSVRSSIADVWTLSAKFAASRVETHGWVLVLFAVCAAAVVLAIGPKLYRLRNPRHVRRYLKGHFDGIDWIWQWRGGRVDQSSLRPFCPECQTEIQLTPANDGRDTNVFCTTCNLGRQFVNVSDLRDHVWRKVEANGRTGRWQQHRGKKGHAPAEQSPLVQPNASASARLGVQETVAPSAPASLVKPPRSVSSSKGRTPVEQIAVTKLDATPEEVAHELASLHGRFAELHAYEQSLNRKHVVWPARVHQVVDNNEAMPLTVFFDPRAVNPMRYASFQRSFATRLFALRPGDLIEVSGVLARAMPGQFKVDADNFRVLERAEDQTGS